MIGDWRRQKPANAPSPRKGIGIVYEAAREVIVAAGGN
jgi:hypothetical protein